MDKGAWRATVYEVTQLKRQNIHTYVSLFFLANNFFLDNYLYSVNIHDINRTQIINRGGNNNHEPDT